MMCYWQGHQSSDAADAEDDADIIDTDANSGQLSASAAGRRTRQSSGTTGR